ncbi:MAG: CBS domain-containing protein [Candidatus Pacearchaeota archaeon]|nr:CBS domain-containing protein [Candidatus Pacearchaeota archaeon]
MALKLSNNQIIHNKVRVAIGDLMTRNFAAINPEDNLHKASKEMIKEKVNSLLITKDRKLIGIITARDVLWAITKKGNLDLKKIKAIEIATKKVAVIKPSADISQAINKMKQYGFRRLPVLSKGNVVGMITLKDILKVDPTLYSQLGELSSIKEEFAKLKKIKSSEWEQEGLCEECDSFSSLLKVDGRLLCLDCRNEL